MSWQEAKVGNGTLIAHCGGRLLARGDLDALHTPDGTRTWRPVPHAELVGSLISGLSEHQIAIKAEKYCVSGKNDARIFGIMDLEIPHLATPEYGLVLGFRGANDQSLAISAVAGARIFVCDNLALSGDGGTIVLKRKHSAKLDLQRVVPPAIDAYLEKAGQFVLDIQAMKEHELTENQAKALIYDAFAFSPIMNRRLFPIVAALYFKDEKQGEMFPDRNLWSLNQSFTEAVKVLPPVTGDRSSRAIGRFFARVVNQTKSGTPKLGWDVPAEDDEIEGEVLAPDTFID